MNRIWVELDQAPRFRAFDIRAESGRVIIETVSSPDTGHNLTVRDRRSLTPNEAHTFALMLTQSAIAAEGGTK